MKIIIKVGDFLNKAYFVKYKKMNLDNAIIAVEKLLKFGSTPIEYTVIMEYFCSIEDIQNLFLNGKLDIIKPIAEAGINSTIDNTGVWQCIKLVSTKVDVVIYTAGSSDVLYYSVL